MIARSCQACGCLETYHSRGYCLKHYQALWREEKKLSPAERELIKDQERRQRKDPEAFWEFVKQELGIG